MIEEADLTPELVEESKAYIEQANNPSPDAPGELEMLAAAGERIIEGHRLKKAYESQRTEEAKKRFCEWMAKSAFWPE